MGWHLGSKSFLLDLVSGCWISLSWSRVREYSGVRFVTLKGCLGGWNIWCKASGVVFREMC